MSSRPKLFLTFVGLCLVPLLLLTSVNYWNGRRIAEAALQREQQVERAAGKDPLMQLMAEHQKQLNASTTSNFEQLLADVRRNGWIGLLTALLLASLSGWMLSRQWGHQARGIERVSESVEAFAKGELDRPIELQSSDDLRPLAENLSLMTKQLRDQLAREAETRQFQSFVRLSAVLTHDLKNAIEALSLTVGNMERHFDNKEFRADAMKSLTGCTDNLRALVSRLSNPVATLSGEHKRRGRQT